MLIFPTLDTNMVLEARAVPRATLIVTSRGARLTMPVARDALSHCNVNCMFSA